jgi:dihydropteroate synthase
MSTLRLGKLDLRCPAVMGILNATPDSFSDGGKFATLDAALRQVENMAAAGASIIDIGGESTRPGAGAVSEQEEIDRVAPLVEAAVGLVDVPVSIDTSKPGVMRAAVAAGAAMINDVRALREEGALKAAADLQRPVCLMHMLGQPRDMQANPQYDDVVAEITLFLRDRMTECLQAGLAEDMLLVDPGFGFGKTAADNVELLANLRQLQVLGRPVVVGISRKSTLGVITGRELGERMPASVAAAVLAVERGAQIVRVHDVAETVDALRVVQAVLGMDNSE